jgi:hypothetical protein
MPAGTSNDPFLHRRITVLVAVLIALTGAGCSGGSSDGDASIPPDTCSPAGTSANPPLSIAGDNSPSGIYDPSVLKENCTVWLSYSSVDYYQQGGHLVQDVGIRLASSDDGGDHFSYVATLGTPQPATVHDTTGNQVCGQATCTGRWVYETSWLIDDSGDPQSSRRYKLFAHKYFLYPPATAGKAAQYELGSIVMWTASSPDGTWSAETSLLGWNLTPQELTPAVNVNAIDPQLASCIAISEGTASVRGNILDFAFACPYLDSNTNTIVQKIVLLRSTDHAASFSYVSTPLQAADAASFGADYFSAPSLLPRQDSAPVLFATPVKAGVYSGCVVFPFADENAGTLTRSGGVPTASTTLQPPTGDFGGACAWDRGLDATGILMNDGNATRTPIFSVLATGTDL